MDNRTIEEIRKNETELIKILDYQTDKLDQYKNNWEELKKWLEAKINDYKKYDIDDFTIYQHVLIKMKELEGE